jgi:purine-binding chemotaxis protein CheW
MPETEHGHDSNRLVQMVTFDLGREEYGIDILQVQEIDRLTEITVVPHTDPCIEGVINLRGKVIPIINLRRKFGMPEKERDDRSRIIVVNANDDTIGIIVDGVSEVLRVPGDSFEDAPRLLGDSQTSRIKAAFIKAIAKLDDRMVIYLNLESVVSAGNKP